MKVTAFLKNDTYPYYAVISGDLQENFDVIDPRGRTYNHSKVLAVKPLIEYEQHRQTHIRIQQEYNKQERKLRLEILKSNGVDFINTEQRGE